MLIQVIFQYLNEASSVFFMVVLMQYIKQQIKFFTIIDNQTNVGHISVPDFWYHDNEWYHDNDFFLFESSGFEFKVVLKYENLRLPSLRSMRDQVNW